MMNHNSNKRGLEASAGWPAQGGLRLKSRGVLGKRAAPTTPVPSWKVFNNQLYDGIAAAAAAHIAAGKPVPLSARKLAASLWELQELPLPDCLCSSNNHNNCASSPPLNHHPHHPHHNSSRMKEVSELSSPLSQADGYLSPRSFDNHHSLKVAPLIPNPIPNRVLAMPVFLNLNLRFGMATSVYLLQWLMSLSTMSIMSLLLYSQGWT